MLTFINDVQIELAEDCKGFYTCTLPSGKQVEVSLSLGTIFVYVPRKAGHRDPTPWFCHPGRCSRGLQIKDVKSIRALISHLLIRVDTLPDGA